MGYIFVFIAIFCGATKGFCGKKTSDYTTNIKSATYFNLLRMALCIFIGFFFVLIESGISSFSLPTSSILISALSGISTSAFVISWLFAVRRGAYVLVDVFLLLGTILPIILSYFFYGDVIDIFDGIGFAVLLIATIMLFSYSNKVKQKIRFTDYLIFMLTGIANGVCSFSQKMFVRESQAPVSVFNFYTYIFATALLGIFFVIFLLKEKSQEKIPVAPKKVYMFVTIMSVCLFLASYFSTLSAKYLSSAQLYPLSQGSAIILSTIMASAFFGEKINAKLIFSICLAIVGLLIMNVL